MRLTQESNKIAIVHDWLVSQRGGENVLDAICELFPNAHLYTLVHVPGSVEKNIAAHEIHTSLLQKVPQASKRYRHLLPLMPFAIEQFDMSSYDLILSSSHCVAKGVRKRPGSVHVSYVHAPMRYMWDRFDEYFGKGRYSMPVRAAAHILRPYLQGWDRKSASGVDHFIANSKFIASKIKEYYSREASVIYPFCETESFQNPRDEKNFYLVVTALVPYKRVDMAIEAFNKLQMPLKIVGDGPDLERLKHIAGSTIEFLPPLKREGLSSLYSKCKALVFPGIEDFGIVPLEAMSSGAPVIAYGVGGALETVIENKTGIFFHDHSVDGLIDAIIRFEKNQSFFSAEVCRARGTEFSRKRFQNEYLQYLKSKNILN